MRETFLSLKNWALWCFYASFAMLLYIPINGSVYNDYIIIISALAIFIRVKENLAMKMVCLSSVFASVWGLIAYYYDQYYIFSIQDSLGGELYYGIWVVVSMSPLIYNMIKTTDLYVKIGICIVGVSLIPGLLFAFTSPRLWDISLIVFSLVIMGFFIISALDTNDKTTRDISLLSGIGGITMMLYNIENIVFYVCDKPKLDSWFSWLEYDKTQYPVFSFCMDYRQVFTWMLLIGCMFMLLYFAYILKRSNYTLKTICIPAIVAFVLIWLVSIGVHSSFGFLRHKYVTSFFDMFVYMLFAYSFYKLNKKL